MTNDKIILIADGCTADSADDTQRLLNDMYLALANVLVDHELYSDRVHVFTGNMYAHFEDRCPNCRHRLQLGRISREAPHFATAPARCSCGWRGRAVYNIIDYEENFDTSTAAAMMNPGSCVTEHNQPPTYVPYYDVTRESFQPGETQ